MKEVRWTNIGIKSLQETSNFILDLWNTNVHEEFVKQLDYRIKQLQRNPELAAAFENTQIRRLVIHRTVSLFYLNTSKFIKILLIWDNRQDTDKLFEKLSDPGQDQTVN